MHRRYEPMGNNMTPHPSQGGGRGGPPLQARGQGEPQGEGSQRIHKKPDAKNPHPVTKFIPQSVYNPQTGKILGFLSAEDLLLLGLIFLLLDSGDECEDNSMLIYALLYILLSGHIDLPF